jgi:LPS sulfotransferase NodH
MAMADQKNGLGRSRRPVFVMGCHRSGTNLLYDTLLSAGGFAVYRGYLPIYKILIPRFGKLDNRENRKKVMEVWLRSKGFRRSGLDGKALTEKVLNDCRTGGDFIRFTMDEIARSQNAARWAVYDPDNVLHIARVKRDIPEALFIHIIRDGRDIALSLQTMGGFKPLPWDRGRRSLLATAAYWRWMVRRGRKNGRIAPNDYIEIHYEDLVSNPRQTLARLSEFLEHDLDYDRIQDAALGRLRESNSSFRGMVGEEQVSPVQRWKQRLSTDEIAGIEALAGDCLVENGYELVTTEAERRSALQARWMRLVYDRFLASKFWLKIETPVGRLANMEALELADPVATTEAAPEQP